MGFRILVVIWIWSLVFCTHIFKVLALFLFFRCKEHSFPLSPGLGIWRMLEVSEWDLESLS